MNTSHRQWLLELTNLPTAAGREGRVVNWVREWCAKRPSLELLSDVYGNLTIKRKDQAGDSPIYFTAHMDHPAFFVLEKEGDRRVTAEFRGGVNEGYFVGTKVNLYHADQPPQPGVVLSIDDRPAKESWGANDGQKRLVIEFEDAVGASHGDVMTWALPPSAIDADGRLRAPACDDLAGLAAALAALDELNQKPDSATRDVRVLLTRAEEIGFVGAIGACKAGTIPKLARLVALENSKSFPESPIGAGPIVRVGDFTSTFHPELTYKVGKIAQAIGALDKAFKHQRKLMPGGTCEASAYQAYGYISTCICLPLGNYHNMNETTKKIDSETIAVDDYDGMIRLLVAIGERLDDGNQTPGLIARLDDLFKGRESVLVS